MTFLTFWPIRCELRRIDSLLGFLNLYSIDSNLDVWVLMVLHLLALPLCFVRVAGLIRRHRRRYANARMAIHLICYTTQAGCPSCSIHPCVCVQVFICVGLLRMLSAMPIAVLITCAGTSPK